MSESNPPRKQRFAESHVPPKLRSQAYDILNAVALSLEHRLAIPALMMIYAGIDGMAYVSLASEQLDVQASDFRLWTDTYLLPNANLPCSADDLYAARCGLVHSQQVDSRLARKGGARHLWYHVGPSGVCLIPCHQGQHARPVLVEVGRLANAFHASIDRFFDAIESDKNLETCVWNRAQLYFDEVIAHGEPMTDGSWIETIPPDFGFEE